MNMKNITSLFAKKENKTEKTLEAIESNRIEGNFFKAGLIASQNKMPEEAMKYFFLSGNEDLAYFEARNSGNKSMMDFYRAEYKKTNTKKALGYNHLTEKTPQSIALCYATGAKQKEGQK